MKLQTSDCISDRTAVVAAGTAPPTITLSNGNLVSSSSVNNQWYFNDTLIVGATQSTYTPLATGIYTVHTVDNSGCELISPGFAFTLDDGGIGLSVTPNPNRGIFNVSFDGGNASTTAQIDLIDVSGRKCYTQDFSNITGIVTTVVNAGYVQDGVYILSVRTNNKWYKKKILIVK